MPSETPTSRPKPMVDSQGGMSAVDETLEQGVTREKRRTSMQRNDSLDLLRSVSAFGIVWFHIVDAPARDIGYTGLVVFVLLSVALSQTSTSAVNLSQFALRRFRRLAPPWAFWCVIYLPVFAYRIATGGLTLEELGPSWLLVGTSVHLWYLPFAFFAGIGSVSLRQSLISMPSRGGSLVIALAGTALLAFSASVVGSVSQIAPIPQWIYAAPSILFGLAIGVIVQQSQRRHQVALFAGVIGVLWLTCIGLWLQGVRSVVPQYALGVPLVCCAYLWPARGHRALKAWGDLSFGIYLIHPLVSSVLEHALLTPLDVEISPIPRILLVYGLSLTATYGIRKTPIRRFC